MVSQIPAWLDFKMLELWLEKPVEECVKKDGFNKGDNFMSDMHRILVKTKDEEIPLIVKCRTEQGPTAEIQRESSMFRREQELYGTTIPKMDQLLRSAFSCMFPFYYLKEVEKVILLEFHFLLYIQLRVVYPFLNAKNVFLLSLLLLCSCFSSYRAVFTGKSSSTNDYNLF